MIKVLLTDGNYNNTLAAVRLLGKKGIICYVSAEDNISISGFSKYCKGTFKVGHYFDDLYIENIKNVLKENNFDVLLPMGYTSNQKIIEKKEYLEKYVHIPVVNKDQFNIAGSKEKSIKLVEKLDIPVPKTIIINSKNDLKKISLFPQVIKTSMDMGTVQYANNYKDLVQKYEYMYQQYGFKKGNFICQEYIPGKNGYGFYGFYWNGELIDFYIHERIHMYPRLGGASTLAKTIFNEKLFKYGKKILDNLKWHGVAMVEFKQHSINNKYYFIEINPKYWGSLALGISAGVEFPYYHVMYAMGNKVKSKPYKKNQKFRFIILDMRYALSGKNKIIEVLKWFFLFFNISIKSDLNLLDLKPTLYHLILFIKNKIKKIKKRRIVNE